MERPASNVRGQGIRDLGCTNSIDVLIDRVPLEGRFVIDVGCGDMTFSRQLVSAGARVLAVDPDPGQAERNRAAEAIGNVTFVETHAAALPAPNGTANGVLFSFSLHHVPSGVYPAVFDEVLRVLKPDGFLCVIEPAGGPLNEVMKLFHDEEAVRADAQRALATLAIPRFERHAEFTYHSVLEYESFDDYATSCTRRTYNTGYTEAEVRRSEVEQAFARYGGPEHRFTSPKRMMLLERPTRPG